MNNRFCDTVIYAESRFVEYLWSSGGTDSIIISSPGDYFITCTDVFGFQSVDTISVSYQGNYLEVDTTICSGENVVWDTELSNSDFSFEWNSGDTVSSVAFANDGDYWVSVTDVYGCTYISDTLTVIIDTFPSVASIGPDSVELCAEIYFLGIWTDFRQQISWYGPQER